jgi:hypothetical protein
MVLPIPVAIHNKKKLVSRIVGNISNKLTHKKFGRNGVHWWNNWMNSGGSIGGHTLTTLENRKGEVNPTIVKIKPQYN